MNPIHLVVAVIVAIAITGGLVALVKATSIPKKAESIQKLIKQKKIPQAIKIARQIISKDNNNYIAHYYLGKAYLADNRAELALSEYRLVADNALFGSHLPENEFRKELAYLYTKFNRNDDALKEYLLLSKLEPRNAEHFFNAGKIYLEQNRADIALKCFQKAVLLDKKHAKAHAELGLILYRAKQLVDAKKEIDIALKLNPQTYSGHYYLGKIYKDSHDYGNAIKEFEISQHDAEFKQKALIEKALCYMMGNRYDNAIIDLQRAIDIDKDNSKQDTLHARYFLAACYEKMRQLEKALEQWHLISKKSRAFRDVAQKLAEYKDVQTNDSLKDYLTSSPGEFVEICKKIVTNAFEMTVTEPVQTPYGAEIFATNQSGDTWINVRRQACLLRFFRDSDTIEERSIHEMLDTMKSNGCTKGFMLTSSEFSRNAQIFSEGRPVELIERPRLEQLLKQAGV